MTLVVEMKRAAWIMMTLYFVVVARDAISEKLIGDRFDPVFSRQASFNPDRP
jgi:hypothetical protein